MIRKIECKSKEEWLEERRKHIGGSDAPAIMRLSPWGGPIDVAVSKWGLNDEFKENEAMTWGSKLEPVIRESVAQRTGMEIDYPGQFSLFVPDEKPWQSVSLDGLARAKDRDDLGVLEIKCVAASKEKEWDKEPPIWYQCQIQHAMSVMGLKWGMFGVLFGGNRLEMFHVNRHDAFIALLEKKEEEFWNKHVLTKEPPELKTDDEIETWLKTNKRVDVGETVELPREAIAWDMRRRELKREIKDLEDELRALDNKIKMHIGTAEFGTLGGLVFHYKLINKKAYTVPAKSYRQLTVKGDSPDE